MDGIRYNYNNTVLSIIALGIFVYNIYIKNTYSNCKCNGTSKKKNTEKSQTLQCNASSTLKPKQSKFTKSPDLDCGRRHNAPQQDPLVRFPRGHVRPFKL